MNVANCTAYEKKNGKAVDLDENITEKPSVTGELQINTIVYLSRFWKNKVDFSLWRLSTRRILQPLGVDRDNHTFVY